MLRSMTQIKILVKHLSEFSLVSIQTLLFLLGCMLMYDVIHQALQKSGVWIYYHRVGRLYK